jgi:hypothetical protein
MMAVDNPPQGDARTEASEQAGPEFKSPPDVQVLVKSVSLELSPATTGVIYRHVSSIFKAAVSDRRLVASPRVGLRLPRVAKPKVEPLATETVVALADAVPVRYRALSPLRQGCGRARCSGSRSTAWTSCAACGGSTGS